MTKQLKVKIVLYNSIGIALGPEKSPSVRSSG